MERVCVSGYIRVGMLRTVDIRRSGITMGCSSFFFVPLFSYICMSVLFLFLVQKGRAERFWKMGG